MADLEQLKQKYAGVISTIQGFADLGAKIDQIDLDGEKLLLKASVPSTVVANRVWDEIKKADSTYADLHHEIATSGGAEQPYTIKSGDNLSHIAQRFYGAASKYSEVAKANGIADPDKIKVGQTINLPVIS
ncbi:LysM domain protein [Acidisarcina polymorpha]|uniref:LysM domain protein n=1 Tax=Acidisarcina polymorpha TaxID=2211140 RepID=A0A2Z5FYE5_9BACT|nr:LysM peptidoglycan-binding domain-containing protein [Acidisarcina polymorpha]AXC11487.1 LysM domain protein [Acidisarcina polymorpha]